jgi:hypothetical protein
MNDITLGWVIREAVGANFTKRAGEDTTVECIDDGMHFRF